MPDRHLTDFFSTLQLPTPFSISRECVKLCIRSASISSTLKLIKRSRKQNKKCHGYGIIKINSWKTPASVIKISYFIFRLEKNVKKNREDRETAFSTPNSATSLYSPTIPNSPKSLNSPNCLTSPNSSISATLPSLFMKYRQDSVSPFRKECFPAPFLKGSPVLPAPIFKASKASASPVTLKGLSGQIRMTWIWCCSIRNLIGIDFVRYLEFKVLSC